MQNKISGTNHILPVHIEQYSSTSQSGYGSGKMLNRLNIYSTDIEISSAANTIFRNKM